MRMQVQHPAWLSGSRIWCCHELQHRICCCCGCGVGLWLSSNLAPSVGNSICCRNNHLKRKKSLSSKFIVFKVPLFHYFCLKHTPNYSTGCWFIRISNWISIFDTLAILFPGDCFFPPWEILEFIIENKFILEFILENKKGTNHKDNFSTTKL